MTVINLLNPAKTILLPIIISFILWFFTPNHVFNEVGKFEKYPLELNSLVWFLSYIIVIYIGQFLGQMIKIRLFNETIILNSIKSSYSKNLLKIFFIFTIGAYIIWFGGAILHGLSLSAILSVFSFLELRTLYMAPAMVQGVTIFTQTAIPLLILLYINKRIFGGRWIKLFNYNLCFILIFVLLRSVLNSERAAIVEVIFPILVLKLYFDRHIIKLKKLFMYILLFLIAFIAFFVISEFFRTYVYYSDSTNSPLVFGLLRLLFYFLAPINYSFFIFEHYEGINNISHTFQWIYTGFIGDISIDSELLNYNTLWFSPYTNFEYNNLGGIGAIHIDVGALGLILSFLYSFISGYIFKNFKNGNIIGLTLYPLFILANLGFFNALHFGTSRGLFPLILTFLLVLSSYISIRLKS